MLRFDDLTGEPFDLSYTIEHCNADWRPSGLVRTADTDGSQNELVPTGRQSFGTLQPFINYELIFPNQFMKITRSGNYVLKVHVTGNEDELLLTRRFVVVENRLDVQARIVAARDVRERDVVQQLELTVRHPGVNVQDPFSDLTVVALQNMDWESAKSDIKPMFIRSDELVYDRPLNAAFPGLNEWRNFDLKDFGFVTREVRSIVQGRDNFEAVLLPDEKRNIRVYLEQPDINGRFLIRNDQSWDHVLGADYVKVHFSLPMDYPVGPGDVYIYGGFSDMKLRPEYKMTWNEEAKAYQLSTLLKQGYYNYLYAYKRPVKEAPKDVLRLEGSMNQTENEYQVFVYLRDRQTNTDRLIGYRFFNSRSDR